MLKRSIQNITDSIKKTHELHTQDKLHRRIVIRLWFTMIILGIATVVVVWDVFMGTTSLGLVFTLIVIGLFIGIGLSKIYKLDWDPEKEFMMAKRYDRNGIIILILYILLRRALYFYAEEIYHHNVAHVLAFSFSLLIGVAVGRLIGLTIAVNKTFKANNKKPPTAIS